MKLQSPYYSDGISTVVQTKFGGFMRSAAASDGEIYDVLNMTSDHYPVLATRGARSEYEEYIKVINYLKGSDDSGADYESSVKLLGAHDIADTPVCLFYRDHLAEDGTVWYTIIAATVNREGNVVSCSLPLSARLDVIDDKKDIHSVVFNNKLVIFADGESAAVWYDAEKQELSAERIDFQILNAEVAVWSDLVCSTTYVQVRVPDETHYAFFREGDTLRLTDSNNKQHYIKLLSVKTGKDEGGCPAVQMSTYYKREIGDTLCSATEDEAIDSIGIAYLTGSIERSIPALEHVCASGDRIWGTEGNKIYCCASCDPYNWYDYDYTTVARSFFAEIPTVSGFVGITSYMDEVFLFTTEDVYRIYGTTPDAFTLRRLATYGCEAGSGESFGVAGGALFYNSTEGPACFDGDTATLISYPFGEDKPKNAVGIGCRGKYYLSDGTFLYVYDTRYGTWHKEDGEGIVSMLSVGGRLMLVFSDTRVVYHKYDEKEIDGTPEQSVRSTVEFADISEGSPYHIAAGEFTLRVWLGAGPKLTLYMSCDGGEWEEIWHTEREGKHSETVRYSPRTRCDFYRLKFEGVGEWKLFSLARSYRQETNMKYGG